MWTIFLKFLNFKNYLYFNKWIIETYIVYINNYLTKKSLFLFIKIVNHTMFLLHKISTESNETKLTDKANVFNRFSIKTLSFTTLILE